MARKLKQEQQYQFARQLWDQGDVEGAEAAYRKILRKDSTDSGALYDLGVLLLQKGANAEAAEYLRKASLLLPKFAPVFNNLGIAQHESGNPDVAIDSFSRAIAIDEDYVSALFNRGMAYKDLEQIEKALADFEKVLTLEPKAIDAAVAKGRVYAQMQRTEDAKIAFEEAMALGAPENLLLVDIGNVFFEQNQDYQAIEYYERAIAANDKNVKALYQKALVFLRQEKIEDATVLLEQATLADTTFAPSFKKLGSLLAQSEEYEKLIACLKRFNGTGKDAANVYNLLARTMSQVEFNDDAIRVFDIVLQIDPDNLIALTEKSKVLRKFEQIAPSKLLMQRALDLAPKNPILLADYGSLLRQEGSFDDAASFYNQALEIDPQCGQAWSNKGQLSFDLGNWEEAKEYYSKAQNYLPSEPTPPYNLALCHLIQGNYSDGWNGYEHRLAVHPSTSIEPDVKATFRNKISYFVSRETLKDKHVLLLEEQGIGDRIMFASVIPDLMQVAASTSIITNGRLRALYSRSFPGINAYTLKDYLNSNAPNDKVLLMGSLCYAFRPSAESFQGKPFFKPDIEKTLIWKHRLNAGEKKVVGISWRGGATILNKNGRSLSLHDFLPLFEDETIMVVSLQFGDIEADVNEFTRTTGKKLHVFPQSELYDIDDLAALINALDYVVTVQNTNVHICGSIGKRCEALLPPVPEWRYGLNGDQMPWYSCVNLHRRSLTDQASIIIERLREEQR